MNNFSRFGDGLHINNLFETRLIIILNDELSADDNLRYGYVSAIITAFLMRIFKIWNYNATRHGQSAIAKRK